MLPRDVDTWCCWQVGLDTYEKNGEWEIMGSAVTRHEFYFDCCPDEKFSNIVFSLHLRRRHTFYIMNVILPGIMTSAVLLSIFFCTPSQKVHIGVASLLSFRLFLLNVAETIPRTSDHVPLLGIYLTSTMAITTLVMVATVFVLNLYNMKEKPVPLWVKRVFVTYVARILCMCDCDTGSETLSAKNNDLELQYSAAGYTRSNPYAKQSSSASAYGNVDSPTKSNNRKRQHQSKAKYRLITTADDGHILEQETVFDESPARAPASQTYQSCDTTSPFDSSPSANQNAPACLEDQYYLPENYMDYHQNNRDVTRHPRRKQSTGGATDDTIDFSKDWLHVAAVCDRLFFWFCLIFIAITTLLLFHPLTTSRYFDLPIAAKTENAS